MSELNKVETIVEAFALELLRQKDEMLEWAEVLKKAVGGSLVITEEAFENANWSIYKRTDGRIGLRHGVHQEPMGSDDFHTSDAHLDAYTTLEELFADIDHYSKIEEQDFDHMIALIEAAKTRLFSKKGQTNE